MKQYHDLVEHVLKNGTRIQTGATLISTNSHIDAITVFGAQSRYNLQEGFPLLTTKRLSFKSILHEMIWFIKGKTNIKYLKDNNVSIWDEWVDENGDLGPVYPHQWRHYGSTKNNPGIDQIAQLIKQIQDVKKNQNSRYRRRLIINAWNPLEIKEMALPPCHCFCQFNVIEGKLHSHLYQRSADLFLGVPFNIASYALLTHVLAHLTGLDVGEFIHTFGDLHIYSNHVEQLQEQLKRDHKQLPILKINKLIDIDSINAAQFTIEGYDPHPSIKGEVAI